MPDSQLPPGSTPGSSLSPRRRLMRQGLGWAMAAWGLGRSAQAQIQTPGSNSPAGHNALPAPASLKDELSRALAQKSPLVVMASLDGCPHCRVARQSHLLPMWRDGLPIVQVDFKSEQKLLDFQGRSRTHEEMIRTWRLTIAPTLLFFGPGAREVAERMEGGYLPDFYRAYLEQRLEVARANL